MAHPWITGTFGYPLDLSAIQWKSISIDGVFQTTYFLQQLRPRTVADGLAILIILFAMLGYCSHGRIWDKQDSHYYVYFERPQTTDASTIKDTAKARDISQRLADGQHPCVILWGSQSGTSERFAEALGREMRSSFGINALVADLSDLDVETIQSISRAHFAIFILSTYGEGDPSDNTAGLWEWIKRVKDEKIRLENLRYLGLGLGNSNYKYYNRVLDVVADTFDSAGATALIPRQKADDANGGTEEDYQAWKDDVFALICDMGYVRESTIYQPNTVLSFNKDHEKKATVRLVPSNHQISATNSAIVPLPIKSARELFSTGDRNCLHMELDLGSTELIYKTGDHIGIWPCNPADEIDRLLAVLDMESRREEMLTITSADTTKLKVPSSVSVDALFRHHLEICGPVPRQTVVELAAFSPHPEAKSMLLAMSQDRDHYESFTSTHHITLARLMQIASPCVPWHTLPLCFIVDCLRPLQPRYYSISSSSVISPRRIAVTALVLKKALPTCTISGVTSNYLLSSSKLPVASGAIPVNYGQSNAMDRRVFAHIRKSAFRLPITSSTPLILIGAGTGIAPFRAFLHERAKLHALGKPVGKTLLLFGCRDQNDFIYHEEIEQIQAQLGDRLEVVTAFSRVTDYKTYVQDRVGEQAKKVLELLDSGANMYICGQAAMARDVDSSLENAASKFHHLDENEAKAWANALKKRGKWKIDVWG